MTEQDRGAYTPSEAPLAFDPRAPRPRRPAPMMLVASFAVLLVLVAALFMALRHGALHADVLARPVGAPVATIKRAPLGEPTGVDPTRSVDVYAAQNVPTSSSAAPHFAPEPETPQPRAAAPQLQVHPVASEPVQIEPAGARLAETHGASAGSTVIRPGVADGAAKPAARAATTTPPKHDESNLALAQTRAARDPSPAIAESAETQRTGATGVQIGAYSTRALADRGYADVGALMGPRMVGHGKAVTAVEKDGKTLYRTVITGFADQAGARAFCASITSKGARCIVKS